MDNATALLASFTWELRRAFRELAAAGDRELKPLGITVRDRALLEFLAKAETPVGLAELARSWSVSRQYVHQTLRGLADPSWVLERPDPANRRYVLLSLSEAGKAFWANVQVRNETFFTRLACGFKTEELQAAIATTRKLRTAISDREKP
jgi:DNA-binding MarR family transcriptional regulator